MTVALAMTVGGGVRRDIERFRARSWCAFFECERSRLGRAGVESLDDEVLLDERATRVADRLGIEPFEKNFPFPFSGVVGVDSIEDVSGEVAGVRRDLSEAGERSESSPDRTDELDEVLEADRTSGALSACTLVVEISSVGREIFERWIVPAAYLYEPSDESSC